MLSEYETKKEFVHLSLSISSESFEKILYIKKS